MPVADASGLFTLDEMLYGTKEAWSRILGIRSQTCGNRLRVLQGIRGKDSGGRVTNFYPESDVRSACANLTRDVPKADEAGFFVLKDEKKEQRYGTIHAWERELDIDDATLYRRLRGIQGISGRDHRNYILASGFFAEADVHRVCGDLLNIPPQADGTNSFVFDAERYRTIKSWAKVLGKHRDSIKRRLKGIKGITGRSSIGKVYEDAFYPESLVRERCKDLLASKESYGE